MTNDMAVFTQEDVGMVLDLESEDEEQLTDFCAALGCFLEAWSERIESVDVDLILAFGLLERAAECAGAYGLGIEEFCDLASSCLHLGRERMQQLHCELKDRHVVEPTTWASS